ncbi:MAG: M48 family metalloprotease [Thermoanaerobaculum sp.]|nr:M48 family metalloprotease [Thermoanaerobaculum sp.]
MRGKLFLFLALLGLAGCATNPVTGKVELDLLGEEQELLLGAQLAPALIQDALGPIDDPRLNKLVEEVGLKVAQVSHRPRLPYVFTPVNDPAVNAFALPGGKICITRGLLARLDSEDGLAAVLGHEVAHVTARHAVAAYNRQVLTSLFLASSAAVLEAKEVRGRELIWVGGLVAAQAILAKYSRDQERQSDALGLQYAVAAGYSPWGMVETQKVLLSLHRQQPTLVERLFASHPHSSERLLATQRLVEQLPGDVVARTPRKEPFLEVTAPLRQVQPAWEAATEGRQLLQQGQPAKALHPLVRAKELAPQEGVIRTWLAVALWDTDQRGAAREEALVAVTLAPRVFFSRLVAAIFSLDRDPTMSLTQLEEAERLLSGTALVPFLQGRAHEQLHHRAQAVEAYREALRRDPQGEVGQAAAARLRALENL